MPFFPHRAALKELASFAIDAQFCQQYGMQIFQGAGPSAGYGIDEPDSSYRRACQTFAQLIDAMTGDLQALKSRIPGGTIPGRGAEDDLRTP